MLRVLWMGMNMCVLESGNVFAAAKSLRYCRRQSIFTSTYRDSKGDDITCSRADTQTIFAGFWRLVHAAERRR
jgi:hypothetical protein